MFQTPSTRPWLTTLVVVGCMLVASGCASWRLPQIDPSGERLFVPPSAAMPPPAIGPAVPGMVVGPAESAPTFAPPPAFAPAPVFAPAPTPGNITAPPIYPDAGLPVAPPAIAPMLVPGTALAAVAAPPGPVIVGQELLQVAPQNVVAPIGSAVILKMGVCATDGRLLPNRRVEWALARDGAGQFVEVGGGGGFGLFHWPWHTPRLIDNWHAIGSSSNYPIVLQRGTPDPNDDVQIQPGEAWVNVTSLGEGTSTVTANLPDVVDPQRSRAAATIHWIDAQWVFPPSAVAESGRPHVLTTIVTRRTTGAPLAGWIVRHEVAGGGSLGYGGGSVVEVPTDPTGRASVEVSPTEFGGGTAVVNMVLVRPAELVPVAGVPLEVGRGAATISWSAGGVTAAPTPASPPPPGTFEPPSPRDSTPSDIYTPPRDEPPLGRPRLEVNIRRLGPEQVRVGDFVSFEVTVTNVGDGTARGIHLQDTFDPELSHPSAKPNTFSIEYGRMRDLQPGESASVPRPLTFEVLAVGRPCHQVEVTCEGSEPATASACISAIAPPPAALPPTIEVTKQGPTQHYIGEFAKFKTVIKNSGTVPITNLRIIDQYDAAFEVRMPDPGYELLDDGRLEWRVDRLGPGELREFDVQCACVGQSASACGRVVVTGDGVNETAAKCVEILALVQPPPPATNVTLSIVESSVSTRVGERLTIFVRAENTGALTARDVAVRVLVPQEMTPDLNQIEPHGGFGPVGERDIRFKLIDSLPPQQRAEFVIPVTVDRPGTVNVRAQIRVGEAAPTEVQSKPIEILPAAP